MDDAGATKGERTKAAILGAALELMAERGYEATTMRDVAARAGVSPGNAYYYFASKEHLVQAFYAATHDAHLKACEKALLRETTLHERLRAVLRSHVRSMAPHRAFAAALFRSAADPESPLSPFGEDSEGIRSQAVELFRRVVDGSTERLPDDLRAALPRLLWLLHMGLVLFWIHDRSSGSRRTLKLVDGASELVGLFASLASLPFAVPLRRKVLSVIDDAWGSAP